MKKFLIRMFYWFFELRGYRVLNAENITPGGRHIWLNTTIGRIKKPYKGTTMVSHETYLKLKRIKEK